MKFAFLIYDGVTLLDFAGAFDPITRLKSMEFMEDFAYDVCAAGASVTTFEGVKLTPDRVKCPLDGYDYVFIPGGNGVAGLMRDKDFIAWLKSASSETVMTAVCGGVLLLGVAGFLKGKEATTHPELMPILKKFTQNVSEKRVVDSGSVITARGVTSAIDLGLYICEKLAGREAREKIRVQMDYPAPMI